MERVVWRTTVSDDLLHQAVKKGGLLGSVGAILLLVTPLFFPISLLKTFWNSPFSDRAFIHCRGMAAL